jgi:membrane protein DedA with SNARE-associated domain
MDNLLAGSMLDWLGGHQQWLGLAILLIAMLESLALAGLVVPGVVLLLAVTAMAGGGGMSFAAALAWAFSGAVIGDMLSFALGRFFHQDIRRIGLFQRHPRWIGRAEDFFRRYGLLSIFIGRFVGPIRPIIPMVAGMLDMPVLRFVGINLLSALAWAPVYVTPGFIAGRAVKWPVPAFFWHQALTLIALLAGLILLVILILKTQARWSNLIAGLLCLLALGVLSIGRVHLDIVEQSVTLWLMQPHDNPSITALAAMAPLAGWVYPLALIGSIATILAATRAWQPLALIILGVCLCTALAFITGESSQTSALAMSMLLIAMTALLKNRPHSFWTRAAFMSGVTPAAMLLGAVSLVSMQTSLVSLVNAGLLAAVGMLFALWIVERAGPITTPARPASYLLLWIPLISAIGVLSSLHYF